MKILGIETSCDETAASVVELLESSRTSNQSTQTSAVRGAAEEAQRTVQSGTESEHRKSATKHSAVSSTRVAGSASKQGATVCRLLSNVVASSMDLHKKYGGVVPEIAARSHIEAINPVIEQALYQAKYGQGFGHNSGVASSASQQAVTADGLWDDIDAIAVTYGAGLGGSLLIGVLAARTLAILHNKPLYACNHVEGHVYANFLTETPLKGYSLPSSQPQFPLLALIVSGGHTQLVLFRDHFDYEILGRTQDDAIGEAFDKVAKIIGLPYPGGPSVAKEAAKGDPDKYTLPKAKLQGRFDFSFSGLKTAVLRLAQAECGVDYDFPSYKLPEKLSEAQKADIAASFQRVAVETVVDKTVATFESYRPKSVVIAGGVAANQELRHQLEHRLSEAIAQQSDGKQTEVARILHYTDIKLCTDNAAMIAALGSFKMKLKQPTADPYSLDIAPNLSM
ncbi:tRNA (adenosine(37)-N6)-threonylcarbamoyltransferase complex transferase subunit TsaD [Candidatus Saccharibacteria bacterium]|nr:tRNA (adenosine(37)-N6)-threonylcarbamoyltransferase complex transferase subunit TsaD [Candidatus Saccharibacteria bacterium]